MAEDRLAQGLAYLEVDEVHAGAVADQFVDEVTGRRDRAAPREALERLEEGQGQAAVGLVVLCNDC